MDRIVKNLTIGLIVLMILSPLGLLAVGDTFGEWGADELDKLGVSAAPTGLEELADFWSAPMPDYAFPNGDESMSILSVAYILSAIIGVVIGGGILYYVGKKVAKS